jgi:hypothetical protein
MSFKPINRNDGRHWCNPASANPEDSPVTCPDCGKMWEFSDSSGVNLWSQVEESPGD